MGWASLVRRAGKGKGEGEGEGEGREKGMERERGWEGEEEIVVKKSEHYRDDIAYQHKMSIRI